MSAGSWKVGGDCPESHRSFYFALTSTEFPHRNPRSTTIFISTQACARQAFDASIALFYDCIFNRSLHRVFGHSGAFPVFHAMSVDQGKHGRRPLKPSSSNFLNHGVFGQSTTGSALSEGLGLDAAAGGRPSGKDRIRVRIQQRSSRLLSLLGLRNPTPGKPMLCKVFVSPANTLTFASCQATQLYRHRKWFFRN